MAIELVSTFYLVAFIRGTPRHIFRVPTVDNQAFLNSRVNLSSRRHSIQRWIKRSPNTTEQKSPFQGGASKGAPNLDWRLRKSYWMKVNYCLKHKIGGKIEASKNWLSKTICHLNLNIVEWFVYVYKSVQISPKLLWLCANSFTTDIC